MIDADEAARAFAGMESLDPRGMTTAEDIERIGVGAHCLRVTGEAGHAVMVITSHNGVAWIEAAAGEGEGMTQALDQAARLWAASHGCADVGCQTKRRGLVRRLQKLGWSQTGYILGAPVQ